MSFKEELKKNLINVLIYLGIIVILVLFQGFLNNTIIPDVSITLIIKVSIQFIINKLYLKIFNIFRFLLRILKYFRAFEEFDMLYIKKLGWFLKKGEKNCHQDFINYLKKGLDLNKN